MYLNYLCLLLLQITESAVHTSTGVYKHLPSMKSLWVINDELINEMLVIPNDSCHSKGLIQVILVSEPV